MSKQVIQLMLFLLGLLMIGVFGYFYYIKPQREFIKMNTQECIKKAMDSIDKEVNKSEYSAHYDDSWFVAPLKKQEDNLRNCINAYNSILFSGPEKNLLQLNTNLLVEAQESKIENYKRVYQNIKSENQKKQAEITRCNQLKEKMDKYNACTKNQWKDGKYIPCEYPQDALDFSCLMIEAGF